MLSKALKSLEKLELPKEYSVACFLCDNDPNRSAESIFQNFTNKLSFPVKYFHEKNRGIVPARNCLVKEAQKEKASYLAFFDDDETVDTRWLIELLDASKRFKVKAVWGKTIYTLPENSPKWLRRRNFYGGDQPVTGTKKRSASTNNVLIDLIFLKKHNIYFDSRFNDTGGSDSFLFRQMRDAGGSIISCREAITVEEVPESRANEKWILRRAYKNAHTEYRRALIRKGKFAAFGLAFFYGLWLFACYQLSKVFYPFQAYDFKVFNRRRKSKVKGLIDVVGGKSHEEYRIIHGS